MTNNKIILQNQQKFIFLTTKYKDKINLFITSSDNLVEGTILLNTKLNIYSDFGTKSIIKTPKKIYIKNLIRLYRIFKTSYLNINTPNNTRNELKTWVQNKLKEGQKIRAKITNIDSMKNNNAIDFKTTLNYLRLNKFFNEIYQLKKSKTTIKGYILNTLKGGFSVVIGSLNTFLPTRGIIKKPIRPNKTIAETLVGTSMKFKIGRINIRRNNVVVIKA